MSSRRRRNRRVRRQYKMAFRSGGKFRVGHKNPAGRTGSVF